MEQREKYMKARAYKIFKAQEKLAAHQDKEMHVLRKKLEMLLNERLSQREKVHNEGMQSFHNEKNKITNL